MTNNKTVPVLVTPALIDLYKQAGIDPATGLPTRLDSGLCNLKQSMINVLNVKDQQTAVNRYRWYNLPNGLTGEYLERLLYNRFTAGFFYNRIDGKFYLLPYALNGTIDCYGRYMSVTPVSIGSTVDKPVAFIQDLVLDCIYSFEDLKDNSLENGIVILKDYTPLGVASQYSIARETLQRGLIEAEAEALPFARTNLIANSGVKGMRVPDQDSQADVEQASKAVTRAALEGRPWIPIKGMQEFQDLTSNGKMATNEYTAYMQTLDNVRLSAYGLSTNGVQTKSAHMLQTEQDRNANNDAFIYEDGLALRQQFCDLVNIIWGLGIWCEPAQTMTGVDSNGDGNLYDEQDQSGMPNEQPNEVEENV